MRRPQAQALTRPLTDCSRGASATIKGIMGIASPIGLDRGLSRAAPLRLQ